jgi:hypothetical protein
LTTAESLLQVSVDFFVRDDQKRKRVVCRQLERKEREREREREEKSSWSAESVVRTVVVDIV